MITIINKYNGEEYKCYQANKECATKDSFCTDYITNRWLSNWNAIIDYRILLSTLGNKASFQILLKEGFEVKGF